MKVPLFNHILLLRYAGLFTYLCTGLPLLSSSWRAEGVETGSPDHVGWCVAYVLFGVMYWLATRGLGWTKYSAQGPGARMSPIP